MLHLDLFSGIGGFALAAQRVWPDIEHVFCEIDPFCRAVLKKHWPNSIVYHDVHSLGVRNAPIQVDLLTGGFPCQPFSVAGKRKGTEDERHLWPEMRRVIQEFSPHYVVAENVRGLLSIDGGMVFEQVCLDLEALGYEVQPFVIPACAVNAPHRRDRVWIVAHLNTDSGGSHKYVPIRKSQGSRMEAKIKRTNTDAPHTEHEPTRDEERGRIDQGAPARIARSDSWGEDWPTVATRLCRVDDGLPEGVSRPRRWRHAALKAYGNAIVPQVAEQIFRAIQATQYAASVVL